MVDRGDIIQSSDREEGDSMTAVIAELGLGLCHWMWSSFVGGRSREESRRNSKVFVF